MMHQNYDTTETNRVNRNQGFMSTTENRLQARFRSNGLRLSFAAPFSEHHFDDRTTVGQRLQRLMRVG